MTTIHNLRNTTYLINKFICIPFLLSFITNAQAGQGFDLRIHNFTRSGVSVKQTHESNWHPSHFTDIKTIKACSVDNSYTEAVAGSGEHWLNLLANVTGANGYQGDLRINYGGDKTLQMQNWDTAFTYRYPNNDGTYDLLLSAKNLNGLVGKDYLTNDDTNLHNVLFTLLPKKEDLRSPCPIDDEIWRYTLLQNFKSAIDKSPQKFSPYPSTSRLYNGYHFKTEGFRSSKLTPHEDPIVTVSNVTEGAVVNTEKGFNVNRDAYHTVANDGNQSLDGLLCNDSTTATTLMTPVYSEGFTQTDTTTMTSSWGVDVGLSTKQKVNVFLAKVEFSQSISVKYNRQTGESNAVAKTQTITIPAQRISLNPKSCKRVLYEISKHPVKFDVALDFELDSESIFSIELYNSYMNTQISYTGKIIDLVLEGSGYLPPQIVIGSEQVQDPISGLRTPVYLRGLGTTTSTGTYTYITRVWDVDYKNHINKSQLQ